LIATPVGILVLVAFGFHKASESSKEFRSVAYPVLAVVAVIGIVFLATGAVEAKQYCDELWDGSSLGALEYSSEHCSTLWPRSPYSY